VRVVLGVLQSQSTGPENRSRTRAFLVGIIRDAKKVVKFAWTHPADEGKASVPCFVRDASRSVPGYCTAGRSPGSATGPAFGRTRMGVSAVVCEPASLSGDGRMAQVSANRRSLVAVGANVGCYAIWSGELGAELTPSSEIALWRV
jgi:hypothetical protein